MNRPDFIFVSVFVCVAGAAVIACLAIIDLFHWLLGARQAKPSHRPMSPARVRSIALAEEDAEIDAAIRRQSAMHGRRLVHAGEKRANLEAGAAAIRETMAQGSNGPYEG